MKKARTKKKKDNDTDRFNQLTYGIGAMVQ